MTILRQTFKCSTRHLHRAESILIYYRSQCKLKNSNTTNCFIYFLYIYIHVVPLDSNGTNQQIYSQSLFSTYRLNNLNEKIDNYKNSIFPTYIYNLYE